MMRVTILPGTILPHQNGTILPSAGIILPRVGIILPRVGIILPRHKLRLCSINV